MSNASLDPCLKPNAKYVVIFDSHEHKLIELFKKNDFFDIRNDPMIRFCTFTLTIGDIYIGRMPINSGNRITGVYNIERKEYSDMLATMINEDRRDNINELIHSSIMSGIVPMMLFEGMRKFINSSRVKKDGKIEIKKSVLRRDISPNAIYGFINNLGVRMHCMYSISAAHTIRLIYNLVKYNLEMPEKKMSFVPRAPNVFMLNDDLSIATVKMSGGMASGEIRCAGYERIEMGERKRQSRSMDGLTLLESHHITFEGRIAAKLWSASKNSKIGIVACSYHPPVSAGILDPMITDNAIVTYSASHPVLYSAAFSPLTADVSPEKMIQLCQRIHSAGFPVWALNYSHLCILDDHVVTLMPFWPECTARDLTTAITRVSPDLCENDNMACVVCMVGLYLMHSLHVAGINADELNRVVYTKIATINVHVILMLMNTCAANVQDYLVTHFEITSDEQINAIQRALLRCESLLAMSGFNELIDH